MKKYLILFFILVSNNLFALDNSTKEVDLFVKSFIENIKSSNIVDLNEIINNNYMHIHGTGLLENKKDFLNKLSSKERIYKEAKLNTISIRKFGDIYILTGTLEINVLSNNKELKGNNLITVVVMKQENKFSILNFQATKLL